MKSFPIDNGRLCILPENFIKARMNYYLLPKEKIKYQDCPYPFTHQDEIPLIAGSISSLPPGGEGGSKSRMRGYTWSQALLAGYAAKKSENKDQSIKERK